MPRSKSPGLWMRRVEMKERGSRNGFPDDRRLSYAPRFGAAALKSNKLVEPRMKEWVKYA